MTLRRRWVPAALAACAVALVAIDLVVIAAWTPSAATVLGRVRDYVDDHDGVHFEGRVTSQTHGPRHRVDGPGSLLVQVIDVDGEARLPDATRFTADEGEAVSEIVAVGQVSYVRTAERRSQLDDEKWVSLGGDDSSDKRTGVTRPDAEAEPARLAEVRDLRRLLAAAENARLRSSSADGRMRIEAEVRLRPAFGPLAETVRAAKVALEADRSGALHAVRIEIEGDETDLLGDFTLSRWGKAPDIDPPNPADVDETPDLEEESILAFDDAPLLQPRRLPGGWTLQAGGVLDGDDTTEGCDQVELDYAPTDLDAEDYLSLYLVPSSCRGLVGRESGDVPFRAGKYSGFASEADGTFVQITVGATTVQADTTLSLEAVAVLLADLVPLDFARAYELAPGITPRAEGSAA